MMILLANGDGLFPPFHPILVNFTAGLIPASFLLDLLGAWLKRDALRVSAWWTLLLAAALTPLTALAGWLWMRSMEHTGHWQMPIHMWLGISLAFLFVALAVWRGWMYRHGTAPGWLYALAAAVLLGALMYQGDLGGSMSFGRGIVISAGQEEAEHRHGEGGHGTEAAPEKHGHGKPGTSPATQGTDHGHGEEQTHEHSHGQGNGQNPHDGWRDHIDVKD